MALTVDNDAIDIETGDDLLTALVRSGRVPPGCLCWGGDCGNCLATVDGVAYVRMCQTRARDDMVVSPHRNDEPPPLPSGPSGGPPEHSVLHVDTVVIGSGPAGIDAADRHQNTTVATIDVHLGSEALAIYPGPEVVARTATGIVRYRANHVVVATGSSEIQPTVPGSDLAGILTPTAATHLIRAGVDLGVVAAYGRVPEGVPAVEVSGTLVRFEGEERVASVVTADPTGAESTTPCDTVVVDLGRYPRDTLARMAAPGEATIVGSAAVAGDLPACPQQGTVCPCAGVTVTDLEFVWDRGFHELELIKRATLAGTGTCQGGVCTPYLRSFVAERGGKAQPTFTARPLGRQMTLAEAASGVRFPPIRRTSLDATHRDSGARMDRMGGWWRPWTYGDPSAEYWAVRSRVSVADVGTLGKLLVRGPDATSLVDRLYPCRVEGLAPGRSRYGLMLGESGGVIDDGLISRLDEATYALTFTTGGADRAEAWVRDWAGSFGADVRIMNRTHAVGAIAVAGPRATELMGRVTEGELPRFMRHGRATVAGVPARIYRLSFTGEVSYEIHHRPDASSRLWEALCEAGADLGVLPHGLETLLRLRLEKGHIVVGIDTEPDSTPRRLGMEWAVDMGKEFVGRTALERTDRVPLDRLLTGWTMPSPAPTDGCAVFVDDEVTGYVTSATWSPVLASVVALAWVKTDANGNVPRTVTIDGRTARRSPTPFYDPEGHRART